MFFGNQSMWPCSGLAVCIAQNRDQICATCRDQCLYRAMLALREVLKSKLDAARPYQCKPVPP